MTKTALTSYEERILYQAQQLNNVILEFPRNTVNITKWFEFFGFDTMGDIAFGKSLNMLRTGQSHFAVDIHRAGAAILGPIAPIPWMFRILFSVPGLASDYRTFCRWVDGELQNLLKVRTNCQL